MRGILRVIPSEASCKAHRSLVFRCAPSQSLLEDLVAGKLALIENFDTILNGQGEVQRCLALRAREPSVDTSTNAFAGFLCLQSQVRKHGFSGTDSQHQDKGPILGTVVILFGDREFFQATAWGILLNGYPLLRSAKEAISLPTPAPTAVIEASG